MTGKKITFSEKPISKNTQDFLDSWVLGESIKEETRPIEQKLREPILKRTTIYLPEEIRQQLKVTAAKENRTMTDIIIEAINQYLK